MVVSNPLGPGKFYGSSLPRPRIYNDPNSLSGRVDSPVSFTDPLINWANEAHWSMGGLSFKRLRLMGKIEGNVKKLRVQREKQLKNSNFETPAVEKGVKTVVLGKTIGKNILGAPVKEKRRVFLDDSESEGEKVKDLRVEGKRTKRVVKNRVLVDESENESENEGLKVKDLKVKGLKSKRLARRLNEDFDKVAHKSPVKKETTRVSPRLANK